MTDPTMFASFPPEHEEDTGILEPELIKDLLLAFGAGRGEKGFTMEEAVLLIEWAELVMINHSILGGFPDVFVITDIDNLGEPTIALSEKR